MSLGEHGVGSPRVPGLGHLAAPSPPHPGEISWEGTALPKPLGPERCRGAGVSAPPAIGRSVSSRLLSGTTRGSRGCPGLLGRFAPELSPRARRRAGMGGSGEGAKSPLVCKLCGCRRRRWWRRRRCWLPPAAVGRALPRPLPAVVCLRAHISAAAAPRLASPTAVTPRGWGLPDPAPGGDYLLELLQSPRWRKTFNHGESILLDLCTPATPVTSSLGFSSSFPPLAHLWGTALLQLGLGGQTATAGASRGAPTGPQHSSALSLPGCRLREHLAFRSLAQGFNCFPHLRGGNRGKGCREIPSRPPGHMG